MEEAIAVEAAGMENANIEIVDVSYITLMKPVSQVLPDVLTSIMHQPLCYLDQGGTLCHNKIQPIVTSTRSFLMLLS